MYYGNEEWRECSSLKHGFKYIRREPKPGGGYRYYYDYEGAASAVKTDLKNRAYGLVKAAARAKPKVDSIVKSIKTNGKYIGKIAGKQTEVNAATGKRDAQHRKAKNELGSAKKNIKKLKVGTAAKDLVDAGKAYVESVKTGKKIKELNDQKENLKENYKAYKNTKGARKRRR